MVGVSSTASALKAAAVFGFFTWTALLLCFVLHVKPLWDEKMQPRERHASQDDAQSNDDSEPSDDWSNDEDNSAQPTTPSVTLTRAIARPSSLYASSPPAITETFHVSTPQLVYALPKNSVYAPTTHPV
ncbi:hypothetical protein HAZT_HAZT003709 [Hyalella azteca]|nr:hypothetical protein HAZT_HAZT003709 [Hyalella azteca]